MDIERKVRDSFAALGVEHGFIACDPDLAARGVPIEDLANPVPA